MLFIVIIVETLTEVLFEIVKYIIPKHIRDSLRVHARKIVYGGLLILAIIVFSYVFYYKDKT